MLQLWWTNLARAHSFIFQPTSLSRIVQLQTRNLPTIRTCSNPRISNEYAGYYRICNPNLHDIDHQHSSLNPKSVPKGKPKEPEEAPPRPYPQESWLTCILPPATQILGISADRKEDSGMNPGSAFACAVSVI